MNFLLKTLIPLLVLVGAATGQTPNNNNTISVIKTWDFSNLLPKCFGSLAKAMESRKMKSVCEAPIDGANDHFCTDNQMNKALDLIESSCKDDLAKNTPDVQEIYADWLIYPLNREIFCQKDTSGSYCIEKPKNVTEAELCQTCDRSYIEATLKWKPTRSILPAEKIISKQIDSAKELAKNCSITVSSSSFSFAVIGSTSLIVIGAMLFSP
ncbi:hypothetical protein BDF19DRAFT_448967 [Syncephalis fuscata]|nr:hypothetical protein BDF19DRAFT_448967 [Syncephalis fuscata]